MHLRSNRPRSSGKSFSAQAPLKEFNGFDSKHWHNEHLWQEELLLIVHGEMEAYGSLGANGPEGSDINDFATEISYQIWFSHQVSTGLGVLKAIPEPTLRAITVLQRTH